MKNTAKITTVLAVFAAEAATSKKFQALSSKMRILALGMGSALLEDHYDLLEDLTIHEEFEERFYDSIVVPWCDLDPKEETENDAS